jgi:hypothetical protein
MAGAVAPLPPPPPPRDEMGKPAPAIEEVGDVMEMKGEMAPPRTLGRAAVKGKIRVKKDAAR